MLVLSALTSWVSVAQAQSTMSVDLQALPLPLSADAASVFESARPLGKDSFRFSLRTSGLRRPLTLRLPSPAPEGTSAGLVEGVVLTELCASVGLGGGFDVGFGFGAHLYQSVVDDDRGDTLVVDSFRGRDPRLGFGWAETFGSWSLRPFAQVHLPLGDANGFAGEAKTRVHAGFASALDAKVLSWSSQVSLLYRDPQTVSATTWGPQLFLGTGAFVPVHAKVDVGLQIFASPVLARQRNRGGARLIPSELFASGRYRGEHLSLGVGASIGLPLSRTSDVHVEQEWIRGPTTPTYRGIFDVSYQH